jgi:hypothetical protein
MTREQILRMLRNQGREFFGQFHPGIFGDPLFGHVEIQSYRERNHREYDHEEIEVSEPDAQGCVTVVEAYTVDFEITCEVGLIIMITEDDSATLAVIDGVPWFKVVGEERERTRRVCPLPDEEPPLPPIEPEQEYAILLNGKELWRGKGATSITILKGNTGTYVPRGSDGKYGTMLSSRWLKSVQESRDCQSEPDTEAE